MHAIHLPGAQRKRFWQKKWPREVLFNGPPIIVAGSAAVKGWQEPVSATLSRRGTDMHTTPRKPAETFVKASRLISKPGAVITVRELTLTDVGVRAITSGSEGIRQGAREEAGPPSPLKKPITA